MGYRFCLTCNAHHPVGYRCPKVEAKRYKASAARKARGRHPGEWREQRRGNETATAAGVAVAHSVCRFTTSSRSAKAANVMRSTT
jgi:hypothetical protein